MDTLEIRMLGEFSLQAGQGKISDRDNRSKKVWQLLAYLLCHRDRAISQKELIGLLWGDDPSSSNPENALKITFHRTRGLLDQLWENAGHQLVVRQDGGYTWSGQIPTVVDAEEFDRLCGESRREADEDLRLEKAMSALELYQGEFLGKLSSESWVIPLAAYYQNLYIQTVLEAVPLLAQRGRHRDVAELCRRALLVEPYHETLYQRRIAALGELGDQKGADGVFQELSHRLRDDFGIQPSEETKAVWRTATQNVGGQSLSMDLVLENLQEEAAPRGALFCEYDYFKVLCHVEARAMQRSGKATHVGLLSVTAEGLTKNRQAKVMENLGEQIRQSLRRGDTYARCSANQYIIMLPEANYENSCMVCRRVIASYTRRYPRSPVRVNFMVQPLSPGIQVP